MIAGLCGNVIEYKPFVVYLNVSGVVYEVHTPLNIQEKVENGKQDKEIFLFTRIIYKEDDEIIYGFLYREEKELFDFLRKLRGLGPAISMGIISTLGAEVAFESLMSEKVEVFMRVPKIGKAKASTMLFEAKKKYKQLSILARSLRSSSQIIIDTPETLHDQNFSFSNDSFDHSLDTSLMLLGFSEKEIHLAKEKLVFLEKKLPSREEKHISLWIKHILEVI